MNNTPTTPAATPAQNNPEEWPGMTLDELRMKRMMALVKREVGRERINHVMDNMRTRVNDNGVRGLLFNDNTISGLKATDYMLLGWKVARPLMRLWRRRRK